MSSPVSINKGKPPQEVRVVLEGAGSGLGDIDATEVELVWIRGFGQRGTAWRQKTM
jgi:hypothetical protein